MVQITDSAGNIVNSYEYDEWGNITCQIEGIENEFKYAGQTYDSETGLYYLRARYYDPANGRFISKDSNEGSIVNPLSLNLYTYCYNNPIIYTDSSGNIPVETILDVASLGWSFSDFVRNPSLANFGFLAWDAIATVVPYAPGSYSYKAIKAGTKVLSASDNYVKTGVWAMNAFDRGYEIERALGGWGNNFPVIDWAYTTTRGQTIYMESLKSIKSIDITASSYQKAGTLKSTLKSYISDLANYEGNNIYKGYTYKIMPGASRTLEVAIPAVEMTSKQANIFTDMTKYAKDTYNIDLVVKIVK